MKTYLDMEDWSRKEHFQFFGGFDDPFFGITVNIDFTSVYKQAKENNNSFFLYSLHRLMQAVNDIDEFKYRIEDGRVVRFDTIHVSTTIGRGDGTFGFGFFEYDADRDFFIRKAEPEIQRVKSLSGLLLNDSANRMDVIHFSAVPWFAFTEMKHAVSFGRKDSVPKISTGKLIKEGDRLMLPVSINAHHGLMDGKHVGLFIDRLR